MDSGQEQTASTEGTTPEVSVVIPVYRNQSSLVPLCDRLDASLAGERREYVFVVDGSPDDSLAVLLDLARTRPQVVALELSRNFGQHAALCAGFEAARGSVVCVIDADLQQKPEDLPRFIAAWREGHDFVSGWRVSRADSLYRRLNSRAMNWLVRAVTGVRLHDWGCPIAAIDRRIVERLPSTGEQRRFLKPAVAQLSSNLTEIKVEGLERSGASSYSLTTLVGVALDFAVSFSTRPFQRLAGVGALMFGSGVATLVVYAIARLSGVGDIPRVTAAIFALLVLGVLILIFGALGEFTHRIYRLVQGQPLYEVAAEHRSPAAEPIPPRQGGSA